MSKELTTPLEALWKLYTYDDLKSRNPISYLLEQENLPTYYKISENALKALEIIKDIFDFEFITITQGKRTTLNMRMTNKITYYVQNIYIKTQEEFDLLKEVLK